MNDETRKAAVRERYGEIARESTSCGCGGGSCCGASSAEAISSGLGYTEGEMKAVPEGANLGLGCGNPTALAAINEGDTVVDLGSGAGFDSFLAARRVGPAGRVIGVDMTPEMLTRARSSAVKNDYTNVEFRLGEIEHLPVADGIADLVISNCVINLSTDKPSVFAEAFRVLKPGGRLMVSDIVLNGDLPESLVDNMDAYSACISGAMEQNSYLELIRKAGFVDIEVISEAGFTDTLISGSGTETDVIPDGVVISIGV
ncbi:MAG: arsenite methyltransferase, partial [Spirochaetaceae bacterium]|nr:arsenite methyltransferase [Spirochaetaceae bacterium]